MTKCVSIFRGAKSPQCQVDVDERATGVKYPQTYPGRLISRRCSDTVGVSTVQWELCFWMYLEIS